MNKNFTIVEHLKGYTDLAGVVHEYTLYEIVRLHDMKLIKEFDDYLEALKYLEKLEEYAWLVS